MTAFAPPEGLVGVAALLCGLSADARTLDAILASFTGEIEAQRRLRGVATAVLVLDPGSRRAELRTVAGLYPAEPVEGTWPDGSMLHAKVALLGYAYDPHAAIRHVKLVVSTGNWTSTSLSDHIEMLWIGDLDLDRAGSGQETIRADIAAAAHLFERLLTGERRLLQALPPTPRTTELLSLTTATGDVVGPRFIHSMDQALLGQIGRRFVAKKPWNWVYAGSGFYEQASEADPVVLAQIDAQLASKVTASATRWVAVNPGQPGAFATKPSKGWTICAPIEDEKRAFMHAKFLAAGRRLGDAHHDVTVYLGSGNLSKAGLMSAFGKGRQSRIEAGVVFNAGVVGDDEIWGLLPDSEPMDAAQIANLSQGEIEPRTPAIAPPPILYGELVAGPEAQRAAMRLCKSHPEHGAQVRLGDAIIEIPQGIHQIDASGFEGAYVEVRRVGELAWEAVPVLGADGGFARIRTPAGTVEDLLDSLLAFPFLTDPVVDDEEGDDRTIVAARPSGGPEALSSYPARDAMRIVDEVARLAAMASQQSAEHVSAVIRTLRRSLTEGLREQDKSAFAALGVDFLAPLKEMPGLPTDPDWSRLVDDVASDWGLPREPALSLAAFSGEGAA